MDEMKITRATAKTLKEWAELYEDKTGDKAILPKGFRLYFLPERGFAMYQIDTVGKIMMVYRLCGDAKFWHDVAELIAYQTGMKYISTIVSREIKAYMRFWHWDVIEEFTLNNEKRFICKDSQGRKVVLTHNGIQANGMPTYWCTQYLYEGIK